MNQELEKIYVIGFPKSGNTWLTRLLADVLGSPAGTGMKGDDLQEIASDFNEVLLKENKKPKYKILKSHLLPEVLTREIDNDLKRIVYIKRDFRDVIVSGFFHSKGAKDEDLLFSDFSSVLKRNPFRILKYYYNRFRLWKYIDSISEKWSDNVGAWDESISQWGTFSKNNKDCLIVFTSYEALLKDTKGELLNILKDLKLNTGARGRIDNAIERQSFKRRKEYFKKETTDKNIPFGKKYNFKFLRKGITGGWKNYFSDKMLKKVYKLNKKSLIQQGYIK